MVSDRVEVGSQWGRWTVIRHTSPGNVGREPYARSRVVVRCVCGAERAIFETWLRRGLSTGCRGKRCQERHRIDRVRREILASLRTLDPQSIG